MGPDPEMGCEVMEGSPGLWAVFVESPVATERVVQFLGVQIRGHIV